MKPCVFIAACLPLWAQAAIPYGYPFNAMTGEEVAAPVVRRLKATRKPAQLKQNAAPLVLAELRRRFPCPKPGKKKR